eukprot:11030889-Karenia_brevis.AAC.1
MVVQLKGYNLEGFQNDWDRVIVSLCAVQEESILECLLRRQLEKSGQLRKTMGLYYKQGISQAGKNRSYMQ